MQSQHVEGESRGLCSACQMTKLDRSLQIANDNNMNFLDYYYTIRDWCCDTLATTYLIYIVFIFCDRLTENYPQSFMASGQSSILT